MSIQLWKTVVAAVTLSAAQAFAQTAPQSITPVMPMAAYAHPSFEVTATLVLAQTQSPAPPSPPASATPLAFDVVTIHHNKSGLGPPTIQSPQNGDSIVITNMSVRMILGFAFDLARYSSIDGLPSWADNETYDIIAKVAAPDLSAFREMLPRQRNPMLQPLLTDRFHLKFHFESRPLPAYALVVAKGGSKLVAVQPAITEDGREAPGGIRMASGRITGNAASIAPLIDALSVQLGRPVVDRTGLTGHYNFALQFAPAQASTDAQSDAGPSLFTAAQDQLGLRLEPIKTSVPVLVIDHVEKPSAN
ncbi:MAG: TIGR03435 family protein [Acidobacteriaceae bacterium]